MRRVTTKARENCRKFLANTVEFEGCLLWQGTINDKGYAIAKLPGTRQNVHVSRYLKLHEVDRTDEQVENLSKNRVAMCERFSHCCNTTHMKFIVTKPAKTYEDMPDWRQLYGSGVRGLPYGS